MSTSKAKVSEEYLRKIFSVPESARSTLSQIEKSLAKNIDGFLEAHLVASEMDPRALSQNFEDCRVPKSNLLGKEGMGFLVAMKTLDQSRPGVAAQALGIAQGALDEAVKYSRERVQFGKPISAFQGIQFMLADMATQVEASRALTYQVAKNIDAGES